MATLFGGLALMLLVAMLGVLRIGSGRYLWIPTVGAAACCLILGTILMEPGRLPPVPRGGRVRVTSQPRRNPSRRRSCGSSPQPRPFDRRLHHSPRRLRPANSRPPRPPVNRTAPSIGRAPVASLRRLNAEQPRAGDENALGVAEKASAAKKAEPERDHAGQPDGRPMTPPVAEQQQHEETLELRKEQEAADGQRPRRRKGLARGAGQKAGRLPESADNKLPDRGNVAKENRELLGDALAARSRRATAMAANPAGGESGRKPLLESAASP